MFNKQKWEQKDLTAFRDEIIKEKIEDHSIIEGIDFNTLDIKVKGNKLKGIPFAIKDNFTTKHQLTTSASKIIRNFKPNFNSTVLTKLVEQGAVPLFKANLDELAMGGTGLTSNYGPVYNPFDKNHLSGGSSSGSNYLVADGTVPFSIGSDTGDSVRKPAAWTGIVGFKPTWGIVSRYGMYDFAPSWDTVAWFTNTIKESALLLDILQGKDEKDFSSLSAKDENCLENIELNEEYNIVVIKDIEDYIVDKEIFEDYKKAIELLKNDGHKFIEVEINKSLYETVLTIYRVISSVEAFSCNSNLTGFHFGKYFEKGIGYEEGIESARTNGFGYEVKKRFLYAQEVRYSENPEYLKALKMRRLLADDINGHLSKGDVLLIPSTPTLSPTVENGVRLSNTHILDNFLTIFNANGSPSLSMPITKNGHKSTSVNISALPFNDKKVLKLANRLEVLLND